MRAGPSPLRWSAHDPIDEGGGVPVGPPADEEGPETQRHAGNHHDAGGDTDHTLIEPQRGETDERAHRDQHADMHDPVAVRSVVWVHSILLPMTRSAAISNASGSATKRRWHPCEQKEKVAPACSTEAAAVDGSISIPHTGSRNPAGARGRGAGSVGGDGLGGGHTRTR